MWVTLKLNYIDRFSSLLIEIVFFHIQSRKGQRYRFSVVISEMKHVEIIPYVTSCVAFVNAIIMSTDDFQERVKIRNEFIGEYSRYKFRRMPGFYEYFMGPFP